MPEIAVMEGSRAGTPAGLLPEACGETRGLVYRAGGVNRIGGIDLRIPARSLTVVMGPNGSGKSLLLRLMHGLIDPTAGQVLWGGRPMAESIRRSQAMVFQRPVLLRRSVAANIRFVLKHRDGGSSDRTAALLDEVGLASRARQPARLLSGGEQQRLALARALALDPEVLFMDEPTASLDPASTAAIETIVRRIHDRGTKIVFVTHDLGQARRLADDVAFLNHGHLVEHTPASQFFDTPESREARDFLAGRLILS